MNEKEYTSLVSLLRKNPTLNESEQLADSIIYSVEHLNLKKNLKLLIVSWLTSAVAILFLGLFVLEQSTKQVDKSNFTPEYYSSTYKLITNLPESNSSGLVRSVLKQKQEYIKERKSFYNSFKNLVN